MGVGQQDILRLRRTYEAFNARDLDAVLAVAHPVVDWPDMLQRRRVIGHRSVLAYWTHQFEVIAPTVEPVDFSRLDDGRIDVTVRQVVRDPVHGDVLTDATVHHVYDFRNGLVRSMEVRDEHGTTVSASLATEDERRAALLVAGEKERLHASLDRVRDQVVWKTEGLDDEQLRRPLVPSGSSVLGLVKHLASVEYGWFVETFGRPTEPLPFDDDDPEADLRVRPDESTADVLAFYERARAAADLVIAELRLDDTGTAWFGDPVSLRSVLVHMLEETARHCGHLDILRELLDGATGYRRP
jgi:uncharacterized damage-inducible protein DinB